MEIFFIILSAILIMVSLFSHVIIMLVSRNMRDGTSRSTRLNFLSVYLFREPALDT